LTGAGLPKSFWKIVARIDGLAGSVSAAIWGADAGRGIGKTTFCATRSSRDGIGGMSGAFPATASGSDRVGASPCRDVLFVNVAVEEPKEDRGSNREIATLAASRLGFSMTSLSPRLATTTSLSPRAPARLIWLGLGVGNSAARSPGA